MPLYKDISYWDNAWLEDLGQVHPVKSWPWARLEVSHVTQCTASGWKPTFVWHICRAKQISAFLFSYVVIKLHLQVCTGSWHLVQTKNLWHARRKNKMGQSDMGSGLSDEATLDRCVSRGQEWATGKSKRKCVGRGNGRAKGFRTGLCLVWTGSVEANMTEVDWGWRGTSEIREVTLASFPMWLG